MLQKTLIQTSFGVFEIAGSEFGISSVKKVADEKNSHAQSLESAIPAELTECARQLFEYFDGRRNKFDLKLDWGGASDFYKSVWNELLKIPYGHTTSYSAIAEKIGCPDGVRAVGLANRNNPIAIIVPCHRVIGKSGNLQGYFYGLEMKRQLLELENPLSFARQGNLFD